MSSFLDITLLILSAAYFICPLCFFFRKLARSLCHTAPPAVSLGTAIYLRLNPRPLPRTTVPFRSAEVTYANARLPWQLKGKSLLISTLSSFFLSSFLFFHTLSTDIGCHTPSIREEAHGGQHVGRKINSEHYKAACSPVHKS